MSLSAEEWITLRARAEEEGRSVASLATRLLRDGGETFPAMFDAIKSATQSVYLEYYIFEDIAVGGVHLSDLLASKSAAYWRETAASMRSVPRMPGSADSPPGHRTWRISRA